jgi:cell division protein FtsB
VIVFSLCVSFVVIDAFAGERGLAALLDARKELDRLSAEVEAKRRENAALLEQVRRLSGGDPAFIEDIARRELGLMRPGERLFIIQDVTRANGKK